MLHGYGLSHCDANRGPDCGAMGLFAWSLSRGECGGEITNRHGPGIGGCVGPSDRSNESVRSLAVLLCYRSVLCLPIFDRFMWTPRWRATSCAQRSVISVALPITSGGLAQTRQLGRRRPACRGRRGVPTGGGGIAGDLLLPATFTRKSTPPVFQLSRSLGPAGTAQSLVPTVSNTGRFRSGPKPRLESRSSFTSLRVQIPVNASQF